MTETTSEETYPVTDPFGEISINRAKKQEKSVFTPIKYNNKEHNMLLLYKR